MPTISFYSNGKLNRIAVEPMDTASAPRPKAKAKGVADAGPVLTAAAVAPMVARAVREQPARLAALLNDGDSPTLLAGLSKTGEAVIIPTATLLVQGGGRGELKKLRDEFGAEVVSEGLAGKALLRVPEPGAEGAVRAAAAAAKAYERGKVDAAHPNFIRIIRHLAPPSPSTAGNRPLWNHSNDGNPGVPGADVAAPAAWLLTRGRAEVKVAVLDEGVDTAHPALESAVAAEKDFVDDNPTARPHVNDSHGTACAGIIVSRDAGVPGLASECSLVAVRIAKGNGAGGWVFDDFKTADAIDWAWKEAGADVLSNSWGGGPPVDGITRAFERARTKGRGGRGCVIAAASGNSDIRGVGYPARLPGLVAVGASNQWDERKSRTTRDGETYWGSNYGPELSLLAPGVRISTTDLRGAWGRGDGDFVDSFNGTSSATPHVAAAAALILSLVPGLTESRVREVLTASADRLTRDGRRNDQVGWGRLNLYAALRLARRP
jgi:subtilisin family serine protease